jgi:hypothetical protein
MSEEDRMSVVHLCWDLDPRTACGLIVESQAVPRTDWTVPEKRWTGPLGIARGLITCKNCLATVDEATEVFRYMEQAGHMVRVQ